MPAAAAVVAAAPGVVDPVLPAVDGLGEAGGGANRDPVALLLSTLGRSPDCSGHTTCMAQQGIQMLKLSAVAHEQLLKAVC